MYNVVAFTQKAGKIDLDKMSEWLSVLRYTYHIYNIPNHRVEDHIKNNTMVITFGKYAEKAIQQYLEEKNFINVKHINLPHVKFLSAKKENTEKRIQTYTTLQELSKLLSSDRFQPTGIIVTESDLPELDRRHLLLLQKITEETGRNSCIQTTKDGKLIEISENKVEDSKADIHLTFAEIYTIRQTMDILGVKEVRLINNKKSNNS